MVALFAVLAVVAVVVLSFLVNGLALKALWGWFLVPLGLPEISTAWAIGIALAISITGTPPARDDKDRDGAFAHVMANAFARPLLALLVGWIVQRFFM